MFLNIPGLFSTSLPINTGTVSSGFGSVIVDANVSQYVDQRPIAGGAETSTMDDAAIEKGENAESWVDKLVSIAEKETYVMETSIKGKYRNTGADLIKYWEATSYGLAAYKAKQPWCAAFVAWCIREANILPENVLPKLAATKDWDDWSKGLGKKYSTVTYSPRTCERGDIIILKGSHIAIVNGTPFKNSSGTDYWVPNISGNTNGGGSREGNGVFDKDKLMSAINFKVRLHPSGVPQK
jgi:hypothetical protein